MNSSVSSAASRRFELGVDNTGLPATVIIARTWPSPGSVISSASAATGYSPMISGRLRTRVWPRPVLKPGPVPDWPRVLAPPATGIANIAPPGLSKLPVRMLMTSMSHDAVVPNSVVVVPIRP
ncbi:unannotated protein [freshwater metagenome]|uniref:Unannotated protein n=1 Tax=freshwater metagenome TaxID=449393 RepID=A0A6J6PQN4_9ZZZZ